MENESREVVYLSVSLMLLASVISFIVYGMSLTRQTAEIRNSEIQSVEAVEQYRRFNAYDAKTIGGDDVIECITMMYDRGINIFVDYRKNDTLDASKQVVDKSKNLHCSDCPSGVIYDHRYYNWDMYIAHVNTDNDYFAIKPDELASAETNDLRNWFPSTAKYRCYLIYNSDNATDYYNELIANYNAKKGSKRNEQDLLDVLDTGERPVPTGSVVTGVIMISYETLGITV